MVIFYIMEIAFNIAIVPYLIVRFYTDEIVSYSVKCDYHCRAKFVIGPDGKCWLHFKLLNKYFYIHISPLLLFINHLKNINLFGNNTPSS